MKNDSLVVHIGEDLIVAYGAPDLVLLPGFDLLEDKDQEIIKEALKAGSVVMYALEFVDEQVLPPGFEELSGEQFEQLACLLLLAHQRPLVGQVAWKKKALLGAAVAFHPDFIPSLTNSLAAIQAMAK